MESSLVIYSAWRIKSENESNKNRCEICNYEYKIIIKKSNCFINNVIDNNILYIIINIFAFVLSFCLPYIDINKKLLYLLSNINNFNNEKIWILYFYISLNIGIILFIIYIIIGVCTIKNNYLYYLLYKNNYKYFLCTFFFIVIGFLYINIWVLICFLESLIYKILQIHNKSIQLLNINTT